MPRLQEGFTLSQLTTIPSNNEELEVGGWIEDFRVTYFRWKEELSELDKKKYSVAFLF